MARSARWHRRSRERAQRPARSTTAAMAISRSPPRNPSAWPRAISRRQDAVKLNSALRNTAPSAKPKTRQRGGRRLAVEQDQRDEHGGASSEASRNGQSSRGTRAATADR